jgi:hypothetical protein
MTIYIFPLLKHPEKKITLFIITIVVVIVILLLLLQGSNLEPHTGKQSTIELYL